MADPVPLALTPLRRAARKGASLVFRRSPFAGRATALYVAGRVAPGSAEPAGGLGLAVTIAGAGPGPRGAPGKRTPRGRAAALL